MANTFETEKIFSSREREPSRERKENKESKDDPELQAAARMERADYLVKEVKSNKNQLQNIALNIAKVQQTLKQLRALLGTSTSSDDNSILQDKQQAEKIRSQIAEHQQELIHMRDGLVTAYMQDLTKSNQVIEQGEVYNLAVERVDALIRSVQDDV